MAAKGNTKPGTMNTGGDARTIRAGTLEDENDAQSEGQGIHYAATAMEAPVVAFRYDAARQPCGGGNVRSSSVKRVASSVGESAVVVQYIHRFLNPDLV
jgi:hypothetical protein